MTEDVNYRLGGVKAGTFQLGVCDMVRDAGGCPRLCNHFGGCFIKRTRSVALGKQQFWRAKRIRQVLVDAQVKACQEVSKDVKQS